MVGTIRYSYMYGQNVKMCPMWLFLHMTIFGVGHEPRPGAMWYSRMIWKYTREGFLAVV